MLSYMLIIAASIMTLIIGAYLYVMASNKCIKGSLLSIGRRATTVDDDTSRMELLGHFNEFIQYQSFAKQLTIIFLFFLSHKIDFAEYSIFLDRSQRYRI